MSMIVSINNIETDIDSTEQLTTLLEKAFGSDHSEIWLNSHDGTKLSALINPENTLLIFFRYEGDWGFRSDNTSADPGSEEEFEHANGETGIYPSRWLVDRDKARLALLWYFEFGTMDERIGWKEGY